MPHASPDIPPEIRLDGAIRIGATETAVGDALAIERARGIFDRYHAIALADAFAPPLLATLMALSRTDPFVADIGVDRIGQRSVEMGDRVGNAMRMMLARPAFLRWAAEVAGCEPLDTVSGLVAQMEPGSEDVLGWHDDCATYRFRRIALIVHMSDGPFAGGWFEMGPKKSSELLVRIGHVPAGTILLFRVHPDLRHRVLPVEGGGIRRVFAGWLNAPEDSTAYPPLGARYLTESRS